MKPNARILVLDDEPIIRLMVCSRLERAGALVSEAGTCADAWDLARKTAFDAAVFDYRLPDGNGIDLARRLHASGSGFPVVLLSGESVDIGTEAEAVPCICAVFSKPPDVVRIVEALTAALGRAAPERVAHQVGRYGCWKVDSSVGEVPGSVRASDWVAIDVSQVDCAEPFPAMLDCIRSARCGVAVVGAGPVLRERLGSLGIQIDFVADMDELAALSRRPSSPSERAALMGVAVART